METQNNEKYINSINDFYNFSKKNLGLEEDPVVIINFDPQDEKEELKQNTGMFDPDNSTIWLFCHGRHLKDILRSFGHELMHYKQHVDGELTDDIMNTVQNNYDIDNPEIQKIEGPAFQNGSFLLRKYTQSLKEGIFDVYSEYATSANKKRQDKQRQEAKKITVKKMVRNAISEPKKADRFDKLEELKPEIAERSFITGPSRPQRFYSESIQEFDRIFQEIFTTFLNDYGFELENYSEPGIFYEYSMQIKDTLIIVTILPNGIHNAEQEKIEEAILSIMIQSKNNKDTFDFPCKKIKHVFKKLKRVLSDIVNKGRIEEPKNES